MLAITRDGKRGYTANVGPGTVSVLDLEARRTVTVIPVSGETQRISLSADDQWVFTADQKLPRLAVIDTEPTAWRNGSRCPLRAMEPPPLQMAAGWSWPMPNAHKVAVVDLKAMAVAQTIDVPAAPQEVLIRPDNRMAYVSCDSSAKIAAIEVGNWKVVALIDAGKSADGLAWAAAR